MAKKYLPRNVNEVITWSRNQVKDPTQDWTGLCQSHCRQAYGVPAWAGSAIIAWRKIPAAQKTAGGKPSDAPRGSLLYYDIGKFGSSRDGALRILAGVHGPRAGAFDSTSDRTQTRPAAFGVCGAYQYARLQGQSSTVAVASSWTYFMTVGRLKPLIFASSTMLIPFR